MGDVTSRPFVGIRGSLSLIKVVNLIVPLLTGILSGVSWSAEVSLAGGIHQHCLHPVGLYQAA